MTTFPCAGFNAVDKEATFPKSAQGLLLWRAAVNKRKSGFPVIRNRPLAFTFAAPSAPRPAACADWDHVRLLGCGAAILDTMSNIGEQPAFPWAIPASIPEHPRMGADGMTYREWLAGMALQGLLATLGSEISAQWLENDMQAMGEQNPKKVIASGAVAYADALIAELSKPHA